MTTATEPLDARPEAVGPLLRPAPAVEPDRAAVPDARPAAPRGGDAPAAPDPARATARRAAHRLVSLALEVLDRRRTPESLPRAFSPAVRATLASLHAAPVAARSLGPARVRRVHVDAGVPFAADRGAAWEVVVTYARGERAFAAAARIVVAGDSAYCEALRLV